MDLRFSANVMDKARRLIDEGRVLTTGTDGVYVVRGDTSTYAVTVTDDRTNAACTCEHARMRAVPTCSHVAAVLMSIRDGDELEQAPPVPRPDDPFADLAPPADHWPNR